MVVLNMVYLHLRMEITPFYSHYKFSKKYWKRSDNSSSWSIISWQRGSWYPKGSNKGVILKE